jgi:hypothetical protein
VSADLAQYRCDEAEARRLTYAEARVLTDQIKLSLSFRPRAQAQGTTKGDLRPHVVYRAYDRDGCLLYVGVSLNPLGRMSAHKASSGWWSQVARIDIEHLPNRAAALAREARLIALLLPEHNRSAGQA